MKVSGSQGSRAVSDTASRIYTFFVEATERELGVPPSLDQIRKNFGMSWRSDAERFVKELCDAGLLEKVVRGEKTYCYRVIHGKWNLIDD